MAGLGEPCAAFTLKGKRIWVAGHRGMVGAAIARRLRAEGCEILTAGREVVDLRRQAKTEDWIAGIKLCQAYRRQFGSDFISAMPTNLFGPGDNFDLKNSHVAAALLRKAHEAKRDHAESLTIWGSGAPKREFLYVDDCADALVHLLAHYSGESHVNIGTGQDVTIRELAETIAGLVGYRGAFRYDTTKPDGTPRKLLDVSRLRELGWTATTTLRDGVAKTHDRYVAQEWGLRT